MFELHEVLNASHFSLLSGSLSQFHYLFHFIPQRAGFVKLACRKPEFDTQQGLYAASPRDLGYTQLSQNNRR